MVTVTIPGLKQEQEVLPVLGVREVGERIGIPVVVRRWWGSSRQFYIHRHKKCGGELYRSGNWWCWRCQCIVEPQNMEIIKLEPGRWVCPTGDRQRLKWPEVEGNKVVMWEGRCGARYYAAQRKRYGSEIHIHRQTLEVLDFSATAMLVRVSVGSHRLNFLIGRDDGLPFVHAVTRTQTTVADAYDYLVPLPVFNAQMHGFEVKRQGDIFFVPREFFHGRPVQIIESRVRPWPGRIASAQYGTIYSNAPIQRTRHIAERLKLTYPYDLVKGVVKAPDHPRLKLETWHCAIRNKRPCAYNPDTAVDDD